MENKLWVARDADGEIGFFKEKPKRSEYLWCSDSQQVRLATVAIKKVYNELNCKENE